MTSMKLNWMQTGRKPSGLCGAALYISALSHGLKFSKADIVKIVHICEATLTKRLIEFEGTESGALTIEEFNQKAEELERRFHAVKDPNSGDSMYKDVELLCEHRGSGKPHFDHGLCESCYKEFIRISGGLDGGSEPPAFQRAQKERLVKMEKETRLSADQIDQMTETGVTAEHEALDDVDDIPGQADYMGIEGDESESFSDIDDAEISSYLHNEEEKHYKKIIWEEMNREYLEEQAIKEAAAAEAKRELEANMAKFKNCSAEMLAAQEFVAAVAANVAKSKKERQQKRAAAAKNVETAGEAAHLMLSRKRIISKVNHDKLKELFDEPVAPNNPKKGRTDTHPLEDGVSWTSRNEAECENNVSDFEAVDEYEEENNCADYEDQGANNYADYEDHSYYYDEECKMTTDYGLF